MKGITVIISAYLSRTEDYIKLLQSIKFSKFYNLILINDNNFLKVDGYINNEKNLGKYYNVISNAKKCNSKYFLTIDPDDILQGNICWKKIENLSKIVLNKNDSIIINSFYFTNGKKTKFIKKPRHIFNPNTIYNVNSIEKKDIEFQYINYMEDLAILLKCIHSDATFSRENIPFYKYSYGLGISADSNKKKYKNELLEIKKIYNEKTFKIKNIFLFYIFFTRIMRLKILLKK